MLAAAIPLLSLLLPSLAAGAVSMLLRSAAIILRSLLLLLQLLRLLLFTACCKHYCTAVSLCTCSAIKKGGFRLFVFCSHHTTIYPVHTLKSLMVSLNPLRFCFHFQVVCEKPFLAKYTKGVKLGEKWDDLAATISTVPAFSFAGGVTGRGCRVKFKELLTAHRHGVKHEDYTSGVRDGIDDATHKALNTCMQHEDEAEENAAKTKGELAVNEAAKQDRAEKVHIFYGPLDTVRDSTQVFGSKKPFQARGLAENEDAAIYILSFE